MAASFLTVNGMDAGATGCGAGTGAGTERRIKKMANAPAIATKRAKLSMDCFIPKYSRFSLPIRVNHAMNCDKLSSGWNREKRGIRLRLGRSIKFNWRESGPAGRE